MPAKQRVDRYAAMDTAQRKTFRDRLGLPSTFRALLCGHFFAD